MKIAGIVCEYNPFHNGHKYHIEETKRITGSDGIIAVMSGNFVQRGEISLYSRELRAQTACENGADLVLLIPPRFVLRSAQFYAYNAIYILNSLGIVDFLSFGSECGSIEMLETALNTDTAMLKNRLNVGVGYAAAIGTNEILKSPNNILGVEYLRALKELSSGIKPVTLGRNSAQHDEMQAFGKFASASYIRGLAKNGEDFSAFVPKNADYDGQKMISTDKLWDLISYRLKLGRHDNFENILNISEGLNNRIQKFADLKSFSDCVDAVSCKRYPKARVRRALLSILLDLEKSDEPPAYTRVLAANETGKKILAQLRKTAKIPILNRITKKDLYNIPFLAEEIKVNRIITKGK